MQNVRYVQALLAGILYASGVFTAWPVLGDDTEGKWEKAGREVQEAAGAVTDATRDSSKKAWRKTKHESGELYERAREESEELWTRTKVFSREAWQDVKEGSREAWEQTKEESREFYERAKSKIHDVTAPNGERNRE